MTKVIGIRKPWCMQIRKRFGKVILPEDGGVYGVSVFGYGGYGEDDLIPASEFHGFYQMRKCKEGYIPVQMKFFRPSNPRTPEQQAQRAKMILAVSAWQALTQEEKAVYNKSAIGQNLTGYNLFIKKYLLSL